MPIPKRAAMACVSNRHRSPLAMPLSLSLALSSLSLSFSLVVWGRGGGGGDEDLTRVEARGSSGSFINDASMHQACVYDEEERPRTLSAPF
jgi:hypothetical protein